jgi:putative tryptophan/tyrosine transport system substrate-binding protein
MRRREFITLLGGAVAWPLTARAQQPAQIRRVGVFLNVSENDPETQRLFTAFRERLAQLGWADGRSLRIDTRWPADDPDRLRTYAGELVGMAPDVLFAQSKQPRHCLGCS